VPLSSEFAELGVDDDDRASILVVDDLPEKLLVFRTVLEDLGHELVFARSGAEALKEVLRTEFACILLDVNMPDIDGFETANLIRQYKRSSHTPIIFVTSYADEMQTIRGYALGAVDYILSPVVPVILRSKVQVFVDLHLSQRRLRRHAAERVALAAAEAARSAAEENTRRSNFLSHATQVLSASLDADVAAQRLLEMLVPELASHALLALCDCAGEPEVAIACEIGVDGLRVLDRRAVAALPAAEAAALREIASSGVAAAQGASSPEPLRLPLVSAGRTIGALIAWPASAGADRTRIVELADRSAVALENARLYRNLQVEIEERRGVEAQLQAANRRKDEFLAMLSHELRNPLAPIRTALEVIRRVAPDEPKLSWAMQVTGRQVEHMTRLVEDLLDVARINQGKITLQVEPIDLRAVVDHAIETVQPFLRARRHLLTRETPEMPVVLRGDFARLTQVVANLLNNAAKYTEEGGHLAVALAVANGEATISVRDDGIGIDAELLPNVFELFEQGKRSLDRSQGGLGVGLTLVHRLVQMHQGRVEAISAGAGKGSEFRVVLPCFTEVVEARTGPAGAAASAGPRGACRVLVVDDNPDAAEATAVFVELGGHEVKSVGNGLDALASAPVFAPDVVLLDIGLPGMDGYAVAARLRQLPETAGSCLIALTGYGQPSDRGRARDAGFDHHLTKPANPDEMLRLIDDWLKTRAPAGAREAKPPARSGERPA
jgi:signal transduction histidine kinase/DNA-binding response OmpR family regulator